MSSPESKPDTKKDFVGDFVADITKALEEGTAPWCKPWKAGELVPPLNPVSKRTYSGVNFVRLASENFADPRFVTFKQADTEGYRVKKGEKGRPVVYWQMQSELLPKLDADKKPVLDEAGKAILEKYMCTRPLVKYSTVFHASQVEGIPAWDSQEYKHEWSPDERAEAILRNSGAAIKHDMRDRAFYNVNDDCINMRPQSAFPTAGDYYSTALHELAHWTGHSSRMDREFGPKGSPTYAKEELKAEIAAWMLSVKLGLPFNPEQHKSYVAGWSKIIKDEPKFILQACRDAEKICAYCLNFEQEKALEQGNMKEDIEDTVLRQTPADIQEVQPTQAADIATDKMWLTVPYVQKNAAKACGAMWDKENRQWFAPAGTSLEPLAQWLPAQGQEVPKSQAITALSPLEEFAQAIRSQGLVLGNGELPNMDGEWHRLPVIDSQSGKKDGSYMGHLDGKPAGVIINFRTSENLTWKYSGGHTLTSESLAELRAKAQIQQEARAQERAARQEQTALRCQEIWEKATPLPKGHTYLQQKGVDFAQVRDGLKMDTKGNILVPMRDLKGKIHSLQTIIQDNTTQKNVKLFAKDGKKQGMSHLLDSANAFDKHPIALAEGVATAASIHMATGMPISCVFDAGNLMEVAKQLRAQYPDKSILIFADNDQQATTNVGIEKAAAVQKAVENVHFVAPDFSAEKGSANSDFNDYHKLHGLEGLCSVVAHAVEKLVKDGRKTPPTLEAEKGKDKKSKSQGISR